MGVEFEWPYFFCVVFVIFLLFYLSRVHTIPYFGLDLNPILGDTFLADGPWGRNWIFYGGFFLLMLATWCYEKFVESKKEKVS